MIQQELIIATRGRGLIDVTSEVAAIVSSHNIKNGLCHLFLHHTSASLIIGENADPTVLTDLEAFMERLVPDGDPLFQHVAEGHDDMPSHVKSVLTQTFLIIPIVHHKLALGTWQGIFLWEHRLKAYQRRLTVSLY